MTTGFGWMVIIGSIPVAVIGLLFKDQVETTLRSLWFVGSALAVAWLLKFVARHTYTVFIWYRVILGLIVLLLVGTGAVEAT